MFYCKFSKMFDNNIFKQYGVTPIAEDYFKTVDTVFCVADGVTRDNIYGKAVCYPKSKEEVEEWIRTYPNPSGAFEAAKICANNFVNYVQKYPKAKITKEVIFEQVKKTNEDIKKINENRKIDYLKEDYYCCVAVGGIIVEDKMYCFSIGDCHITVLDEKFNSIFTTINNHRQYEDYLENIYIKTHDFNWDNPDDRIMVRKEYRNNPTKMYNGKEVSFGVLSGEREAEHYIDVYEVDLEKAKYVCAYSDGCEFVFKEKETIQKIIQNPEDLKNKGKERTLVIYERK